MINLGMRSSMGRTGVCWDNAMAESFFSALKNAKCLPHRLCHEVFERDEEIEPNRNGPRKKVGPEQDQAGVVR